MVVSCLSWFLAVNWRVALRFVGFSGFVILASGFGFRAISGGGYVGF